MSALVHALRRRDGRPSLLACLVGGHPAPAAFRRALVSLEAHADAVEVVVPFSDPMADGVTLQAAARDALAAGATLGSILEALEALPARVPRVLMSYLNPLLAHGLAALGRRAARAGVEALVVPDLPLEESAPVREALGGLALVQMVTPLTPSERRSRLARAAGGFLYAVLRAGTTGDRSPVTPATRAFLADLRREARVPVLAGFGIRSHAQVAALEGACDGVVAGTVLVEALAAGRDPGGVAAALRDPEASG